MADALVPETAPAAAPVKNTDARPPRGKLTIFLGMAPGAGKTHAMLLSAHREKRAGRDVVIGALETLRWPGILALARGLPGLARDSALSPQATHDELNTSDGHRPPLQEGSAAAAPAELDLDATLARRPQLAVVDELAHANAPGSRHPKRYQDVLELLEAGIDVFTTLNIRDVASRADTIWELTGLASGETVPDTVLDAAELELVDLSPRELLRRAGREQAGQTGESELAKSGLWQEGTLLILREMTARLFGERVGQQVRAHMQNQGLRGPLKSGRRLLAAVGPGANSEQLVRHTRRLAASLNASWVVLHVETSRAPTGQEQLRLDQSLALAQELGAEVITTTDDDLAAGILRVAGQQNVTQITVGKPLGGPWWKVLQRNLMLRRLIRGSGQIDVQVVLANRQQRARAARPERKMTASCLLQYVTVLGVVAGVTLAAFLAGGRIDPHAVSLVFLLAVVALAVFVRRGPALFAAALSALALDYFFLPPAFALRINRFEDAMMFATYFVVAAVLGQLTARIRAEQEAERQREARATALYLLAAELNSSTSLDAMVKNLVRQMEIAFDAAIAVLLPAPQNLLAAHPASAFEPEPGDQPVPLWVLSHGRAAGRYTDNLPWARAQYVPLATSSGLMGVIGLRFHRASPPTPDRRNLLDAFCQQIAMALDRHRLNQVSEHARLLAESERLSKTLLDSMSHEMRTPLAAIQSATGNLAVLGRSHFSPLQMEMLAEIREAAERLDRLVGNVLEATRLESGAVKPKVNECDVSELVHLAVADTEKELARHPVCLRLAPGLPLVPMDFVLTQQALANLLSNAARHTPPGTPVEVAASVRDNSLLLAVADRGPGIPPAILPRIFDKFYRAPNAATGGTGLGLSLVKGFIEAQGGSVTAENGPGGGMVFTIRLPLRKEVGGGPRPPLQSKDIA
jgi:two-component system sensor histidine kinase KdpD